MHTSINHMHGHTHTHTHTHILAISHSHIHASLIKMQHFHSLFSVDHRVRGGRRRCGGGGGGGDTIVAFKSTTEVTGDEVNLYSTGNTPRHFSFFPTNCAKISENIRFKNGLSIPQLYSFLRIHLTFILTPCFMSLLTLYGLFTDSSCPCEHDK